MTTRNAGLTRTKAGSKSRTKTIVGRPNAVSRNNNLVKSLGSIAKGLSDPRHVTSTTTADKSSHPLRSQIRNVTLSWRADDADWVQLRADRHRPAWHLAALAYGLKPLDDLAMRLQAAERTDENNAYAALIRTLEINLTRADDINRLQYVHDMDNDGTANDSPQKKIDRFVDVVKFVRFVDSRNMIVNERLWSIASMFADVGQSTRSVAPVASGTIAANPVPKLTTPTTTDAVSSIGDDGMELNPIEVGTMARMLVALAIHHHDYQPAQTLTIEGGTQVKRGTYAPIYKICKELEFKRPNEWETVKKVLLKASNKIGLDEVMRAVSRHQEIVRVRPPAT